MARVEFTQFFIYRWRYIVGYSVVALLLALLLTLAMFFAPGGISSAEMNSVIQSDDLAITQPSSLIVANAPYYALQAISLEIFGVSNFSIKLPSLILGLLSAVGLIMLLRRWFSRNIAVLASLIAVTTGQFLFIAQNGTPGVLYLFWPVALLVLGTQITRGKRFRTFWKVLFGLVAAFSLYTPLSVYPLIAIAVAVILHPHLRHIVRRLSLAKITIATSSALVILTPLIYGIATNPQLGLRLLGVPSSWPPDLWENIQTLFSQYLLFWEPSATTLMTPVFGFGSTILILLGLYRLIRTRETTRSYLITTWLILLVPVLLLNPGFTTVSFLPSVLMLAAGLTSLIGYWYRLFPFNPYARVAGLIPIVVLVGTLIFSGLERYFYGYHYDPRTSAHFSQDVSLLPRHPAEIVVGEDEKAFYAVVAKHSDLTLVDSPSSDSFVATREAKGDYEGYYVSQIITNSRQADADRFYIYKKSE